MVAVVQTVVFAVYMLGVLCIGLFASRYIEDTPSSFYVADKGLGTVILLFTLMSSILSSFTFFGLGAQARGTGLGVAAVFIINVVFWGPMFASFGTKVKRVGDRFDYITPAEYVRARFDNEVVPIVYIALTTLALIGYATVQIIGGGVALNILMDVPYVYAIVAMAAFMAIYIHVSGMLGVAWTDTIQGSMMFLSLIGAVVAILVIIGPGELVSGVQNVNADLFTFEGPVGSWTPLFVVTFGLGFAVASTSLPHLFQRFLAADSTRSMKRSAVLLPILGLLMSLAGIVIGVWSIGIVPDIQNPDYAIGEVFLEITGPVVSGIILSAAVAALMSTTDSLLLSLSSLIGRDIYRRHINPDASEKREVQATQVILFALIAVALVLAYIRPATIFQLGALAVVMHGPIAPTLYFTLYWDGATAEGSIASMVVGEAVVLGYFLGWIPSRYEFGLYYGFIGLVVTVVVFVAVSSVTSTYAKDLADEILSA
ncbi:sodium:solute symporter family protein [Halococcus hamelinensis]|uniref:SSS sodium solute transporter superfamily protein n=1 Tax=Halococcus hamelinensis 100A6 TaxID=1132509 RepID=M0M901_9EURY|nr:sodium:solute symporter family protein [Halococcus hamelinensis]EMA41084.1 SSS sodium solute transporter superfamily protein [Halococcus hamelinensis 100A6]